MKVSQLYIYPVKSLGGIAMSSVNVTARGFEYDRWWMLIDEHNSFITQREFSQMALLKVSLSANGLEIHHKDDPADILTIGYTEKRNIQIPVQIWDDTVIGTLVNTNADSWLSKKLRLNCRLVLMEEGVRRELDPKYNINNSITGFADGYPILLISEASLLDLNNRTDVELEMARFRPNLVISGGSAFEEDTMKEFSIGGIQFYGVKPCARCVLTTVDPATAKKGKEPLKTLATYRSKDNKIFFGENVIAIGKGIISVGDTVTVLQTKNGLFNIA